MPTIFVGSVCSSVCPSVYTFFCLLVGLCLSLSSFPSASPQTHLSLDLRMRLLCLSRCFDVSSYVFPISHCTYVSCCLSLRFFVSLPSKCLVLTTQVCLLIRCQPFSLPAFLAFSTQLM